MEVSQGGVGCGPSTGHFCPDSFAVTCWARGQNRPSGHVAARQHVRVRDTQTSFRASKSGKCHTDGFPALESCSNYTPAKLWAPLGCMRSSYLGRCLHAQYERPLGTCETLRDAGPRFPRRWLLELVRAFFLSCLRPRL